MKGTFTPSPSPTPIQYIQEHGSDWMDIRIPRSAFELLGRWASVSRTLNRAKQIVDLYSDIVDLHCDLSKDDIETCLSELTDLEPALNHVNDACKTKMFVLVNPRTK